MLVTSAGGLALSICAVALATKSAEISIPDPLSDGQCTGHVCYSYGSYIYDLPSKLDQVFWPATDPDFIFHCPESGLTAFQCDIEQLSEIEGERIGGYLTAHYDPTEGNPSLGQKLEMLESVYALLDRDEHQHIRLLRVLGYLYQSEMEDSETADRCRESALQFIERALEENLEPQKRLRYLFLAERYQRLLGDPRVARQHMREFRRLARSVEGESRDFAMYLIEIQTEQYGRLIWPYAVGALSFAVTVATVVLYRRRRARAVRKGEPRDWDVDA